MLQDYLRECRVLDCVSTKSSTAADRQQGSKMNKPRIVDVPNVVRRSLYPTLHRFPELARVEPRYGQWGWYQMEQLDHVAFETYESQGFTGRPDCPAQYDTFEARYFPCLGFEGLVWITHNPYQSEHQTHIYLDHDKGSCPFFQANLYVPAGWGKFVLDLVRLGVVEIEHQLQTGTRGVLWNQDPSKPTHVGWRDMNDAIEKS